MSRYDPEHGENTTRDVLSRAIFREVDEGRGTEHGGVYLDLTGTARDAIGDVSGRFLRAMDAGGWDPFRDMVEVAPEAHFAMGGVVVDENAATQVPGLFVAGEAACGLHGANRLNSNALIEAATTGERAGHGASDFVACQGMPPSAGEHTSATPVSDVADATSRAKAREAMASLRLLMTRHVGVQRDAAGLRSAEAVIETIVGDARGLPPGAARSALDHRLLTARIVILSALLRRESRGAHFRRDFPDSNPAQLSHIVTRLRPDGHLRHQRVAPGHLRTLITT